MIVERAITLSRNGEAKSWSSLRRRLSHEGFDPDHPALQQSRNRILDAMRRAALEGGARESLSASGEPAGLRYRHLSMKGHLSTERKARHWIWLPLVIVAASAAGIVASEYFRRSPDQIQADTGALIQPAVVPPRDAERARPNTSGRGAAGNAGSRHNPEPDAAVG